MSEPVTARVRRPRAQSICVVAFALAIAACATEKRAGDSRLVAPTELPGDLRRTWETYRAGGAAWEIERERVIADPERLRFVVDNLVVEMVRSYERSRLARPGQAEGPFERAQRELALLPAGATPVLVELLTMKDGIVAFLAADTLEKIGEPALDGVVRKLESETPEVRRRAAELLGQLPHGGAREPGIHEALGRCVRDDEQWIVRAQAARALGARGGRHDHKGYCLAVLTRALGDPDPAVAASACAGLAVLGERRAVPGLIRALERAISGGDLKGLRAVQDALRELSGIDRDLDAAHWASWWQERGARIPLQPEPAGH